MAYDDILASESLADSLDKIKARDNALRQAEAGTTAPSSPIAYQLWIDTSTNTIKRRNAANSAWSIIGYVNQDYDGNVNASDPILAADLDANSNLLRNLGDPLLGTDAVPRDWIFGQMAGRVFLSSKGIESPGGSNILGYDDSGTDLVKYNSGFTISGADVDTFSPNTSGYYFIMARVTLNAGPAITSLLLKCISGTSGGTYMDTGDQALISQETPSSVNQSINTFGMVRLKAGDTYQIQTAGSSTGISSNVDSNELFIMLMMPDA